MAVIIIRLIAFVFAFSLLIVEDFKLAMVLLILGMAEVLVLRVKTVADREQTKRLRQQLKGMGYVHNGNGLFSKDKSKKDDSDMH